MRSELASLPRLRRDPTEPEPIPEAGIVRAVFQPRRQWYPKNSVIQTISTSLISDNTWEWDRFTRRTEPNDIKMNTSTTAIWRGGWSTTLYTWTETFKYPAFLYTDYYVERRDAGGAPPRAIGRPIAEREEEAEPRRDERHVQHHVLLRDERR